MTVGAEDFQLKLRLSSKIAAAFKEVVDSKKDVPPEIKKCCEEGVLAGIEELEWLHANRKGSPHLHELLSGCELRLPEPPVIPRNPELEARIKRLKAEQEEREYRNMTRNVDNVRVHHPDDTIGFQIRQINKQLIAVFQFVLSVIAGFMFGFLGLELIVGTLDFGFRLLMGVICALVIALAEIYFLAKKLAEEDEFPLGPTGPPPTPAPNPNQKQHAD